jgi:hypothetical protein
MKTDRRNRSGWLLVIVIALIVAAYFWPRSEPDKLALRQADQSVANHDSVKHAQSTSLAPTAVPRSTISADGLAAVPVQFQLPGVGRVRTAPSFDEWLAQFPPDQQTQISAFNKSHFGVYRVNSREQVAWMAANGYPMPEDIVTADRLADRDLLKLANQGNDKAAFLLAERQNKELVAFLAKGGNKSAYYGGMAGPNTIEEQTMTIDRLVKQSNSPYKGYIQASKAISGLYAGERDPQAVTDAYVIAGLIWASQLGDLRASNSVDDYAMGNPQRVTILGTASIVSLNDSVDMTYMQHHGGQRAGGRGIPGGDAPVH